ncbi:MAG: DNA pilot protein [Arizlama microvirus]|nr:MAG: DNA pilot protein [Arizlama microvirus]
MGFFSDLIGFAGDLFSGGGSKQDHLTPALNMQMFNKAQIQNERLYVHAAKRDQANINWARAYQQQQDKNSIQWRVADATAAGLHPLVAAGFNPGSGPVAVNASTSPPSSSPGMVSPGGHYSASSGGGNMGQNLSGAIRRLLTREERQELDKSKLYAEVERQRNLERSSLENETLELRNAILRSELALRNANPNPPAPSLSDPSAAKVGTTQFQPAMPVVGDKDVGREAGHIQDYGYVRTRTGIAIVPSKDMKERMEEEPSQQAGWWFRNNLVPFVNRKYAPSYPDAKQFPNRPGYRWKWNGFEFQEVKK